MTVQEPLPSYADSPPPNGPGSMRVVWVNTQTGGTIRGVLRHMYSDALVLTSAKVAGHDGNGKVTWAGLDGDVVIPMGNVDYWLDGLPADALE